jgi:hypothetical protein
VLFRGGVTHRLDIRRAQQAIHFEFQGLLDAAALEELRVGARLAAESGAAVRVELREGTEVERGAIAGLRALGVEVVAEAAYLARWLEDTR